MASESSHEERGEIRYRYVLSPRTVLELVAIVVAIIPIVVARNVGTYQRGFFYSDSSITYPFKEEIVSTLMLYAFSLGIPIFTVICGEYCLFYRTKFKLARSNSYCRVWRNGPRLSPFSVSLSRILLLFIFGFLLLRCVTDLCKHCVGRLRPHYLDVCQPNFTLIALDGGCTPLSGTNTTYCSHFITKPHCIMENSTNPEYLARLRDARLSFMSGHASTGFYSMFFMMLYIESRLSWMGSRYFKAILQFGLFILAALNGISRISDHKHHYQDVFTGTLVGIFVAVLVVFCIGDFFHDSAFTRYRLKKLLEKLDWGSTEFEELSLMYHPESRLEEEDPAHRNFASNA